MATSKNPSQGKLDNFEDYDWKPSRYRENFIKYFFFVSETGQKVLLQTLKWLWEGSIEDFILAMSPKKWNGMQKIALEKLKKGQLQLEEFDFSFLYEVIQMTNGLAPKNDDVWCRRCPPERQDELEYLLFSIKDIRNNLAHAKRKDKNVTDLEVKTKSEEIQQLLTSILQKAGQRANIPQPEVDKNINFVETDILRIYRDENTDSSIGPRLKNLILNDLKPLDDDDNSFVSELKGYSLPYFQSQDDPRTSYRLNKIFTTCDDASVIVVTGEAGDGKSAMTRFLSYSWKERKMDTVENLARFDIVLRVECKGVSSSDVSQFLEDHLPIAAFFFQKTSSFKRQLIPLRVLWIMDGYDEKASGCDGFLEAILQELSDKHKIIITTRPNALNDVQKLLSKTDVKIKVTSLEKFREENINDVIHNLIDNDEDRILFTSNFNAIAEDGKSLLRTPLNMTLYIKLWLNDPSMARGHYTANILFTKATNNQLEQLFKRLKKQTSLTDDDLTMNIDIWFHNYLCKETFKLALQERHVIPAETTNDLKRKASMLGLIPSYCLSSFLVKDSTRDDRIKYDFQHSIQIHVLASLYMKKMEEYPLGDAHLMNSIDFCNISSVVVVKDLLKFYIRIINSDDLLLQNKEKLFFCVQKILSYFKSDDRYALLFDAGVACNFNPVLKSSFAAIIENIKELTRAEGMASEPFSELLSNSFLETFK